MADKSHWESIYAKKSVREVSWYRDRLDTSLELISQSHLPSDAEIIDVGGGASTLVDDLWRLGYRNVSVLDISSTALETARQRLGEAVGRIRWIEGDITQVQLPSDRYDLWHDRAVFHFLTDVSDRQAYVEAATRAVKSGGFIIIATFSPEGPAMCSGLPVQRYDAASLALQFSSWNLLDSRQETHITPAGSTQSFTYVMMKRN